MGFPTRAATDLIVIYIVTWLFVLTERNLCSRPVFFVCRWRGPSAISIRAAGDSRPLEIIRFWCSVWQVKDSTFCVCDFKWQFLISLKGSTYAIDEQCLICLCSCRTLPARFPNTVFLFIILFRLFVILGLHNFHICLFSDYSRNIAYDFRHWYIPVLCWKFLRDCPFLLNRRYIKKDGKVDWSVSN